VTGQDPAKPLGPATLAGTVITAAVVVIAAMVIGYQTVVLGCTLQNWRDIWSFQFSCPPREAQSADPQMPAHGQRVWDFGPATASCSMPVLLPYTIRRQIWTVERFTSIVESREPVPPDVLPADVRARVDDRTARLLIASFFMVLVFEAQALEYAPAGSDQVCWFSASGRRFQGFRVSITGRSVEHGRRCATATTRIEVIEGVMAAAENKRKYCKEPDGAWAAL